MRAYQIFRLCCIITFCLALFYRATPAPLVAGGDDIGFTPNAFDFGTLDIGDQSQTNFALWGRYGTYMATVSLVSATPDEFRLIVPGALVLTHSEYKYVTLAFCPKTAGTYTAKIDINYAVNNNNFWEPGPVITATATGQSTSSACDFVEVGRQMVQGNTPVDFGVKSVGSSTDGYVRVCNVNSHDAYLSVYWLADSVIRGPDRGPFHLLTQIFDLKGNGFPRRSGECQNVYIRFAPTSPTTRRCPLLVFEMAGNRNGRNICGSTMADPTAAPGVISGEQGGLESSPLWLWRDQTLPINAALSKGKNPHKSQSKPATFTLTDLLPAPLPDTTRVLYQPQDVVGTQTSNATAAAGANYVNPGGDIAASVLVFKTVGNAYAHDFAICTRSKDGAITDIFTSTTVLSVTGQLGIPVTFWHSLAEGMQSAPEHALTFAVYVSADEQSFTVDSRWLSDAYPAADTGYILSFQIWGTNEDISQALLRSTISMLNTQGQVQFNNFTGQDPRVLIERAGYHDGEIDLLMNNQTQTTQSVVFTVSAWSAPSRETQTTSVFTETVDPGTHGLLLDLPMQLDALVYADDGAFVDKAYVSDGNWAAFDDSAIGGASVAHLESHSCAAPQAVPGVSVLAGCAQLTGTVEAPNGYIGVFRTLATNYHTIDLSNFSFLRFDTRGDAKTYQVKLETRSDAGESFQYGYTFVTSSTWQTLTIPFSAFEPLSGAPPLDLSTVKAVTWATMGGPYANIDLQIDQIGFVPVYSLNIPIVTK